MKKRVYDRIIGGYPQEYHTHMIDWDNIALSMIGATILGVVANLIFDFALGKAFGLHLFYIPLTDHFSYIFGENREGYMSWLGQLKATEGWLFDVRKYGFVVIPAIFAATAAKWSFIVKPLETIVRGRRLVEGKEAIETLKKISEQECDSNKPGVRLHPLIRLSRTRESGNLFLVGAAGGGKTSILEPVIFEYISRSKQGLASPLIYDFKKEFYPKIGKSMLLAPWDHRTWAIDIAEDINSDAAVREWIADIIPVSEKDPFWGNASRGIGIAMLLNLLHLNKTKKKHWGWKEIFELQFASDEEVEKWVSKFNPSVIQAVQDIKENKQAKTIMLNLMSSMGDLFLLAKAWKDVPKDKLVSIRRFVLDDMESYPKSYNGRVVVFQHDTRYPTLSLAVASMVLKTAYRYVTSATDSKERCVPVILDEEPQLGKMRVVIDILATARSKGMPLIVGVQDITQLVENLGAEEAKTFMAQFKTKIIVKITMSDSAQQMSDLIGSYTYRRAEMRKDLPPGTPPFTEGTRPVIEPGELDSKLGASETTWYGVRALILGMDENAHIVTFPFSNHKGGRHRPFVDAKWLKEVTDFNQLAKERAEAAKADAAAKATTATAAGNGETQSGTSKPSGVGRIRGFATSQITSAANLVAEFKRPPPVTMYNGTTQTQPSIVPQVPLTDAQVNQAEIDDMMSFLPSVEGEDESPVDEVVKTAAVDEAAHALGAIVPGADIAVHAVELMTEVFDDQPQTFVVSTGEQQMKIQKSDSPVKVGNPLLRRMPKKREFSDTEIDDGYNMK